MFFGASALNQNISSWQVSSESDFDGIFDGAIRLSNPPIFTRAILNNLVERYLSNEELSASEKVPTYGMKIGEWDTSHIKDFSALFKNRVAFQDSISKWNVSRGTTFASMFEGALAFNQEVGDWDVSSATDLSKMFKGATSFDQVVGNWSMGSVINVSHMFEGAISFNQEVGNWNVGSVTNFSHMFNEATSFDQAVGNWTVENVLDFSYMFEGAISFNQDLDLWAVSKGTDFVSSILHAHNMFVGNTGILGKAHFYVYSPCPHHASQICLRVLLLFSKVKVFVPGMQISHLFTVLGCPSHVQVMWSLMFKPRMIAPYFSNNGLFLLLI